MNFSFVYAYDETQQMAKDFNAVCTPDFFIYNSDNQLVYAGQLDDSRPNSSIPVTGKDVRRALDLLIDNRKIDFQMKPSIGCNIKWKTE